MKRQNLETADWLLPGAKVSNGSLESNGAVRYHDCGGDYITVYICQNSSNPTPESGKYAFYISFIWLKEKSNNKKNQNVLR